MNQNLNMDGYTVNIKIGQFISLALSEVLSFSSKLFDQKNSV